MLLERLIYCVVVVVVVVVLLGLSVIFVGVGLQDVYPPLLFFIDFLGSVLGPWVPGWRFPRFFSSQILSWVQNT